MSEFWKVVKTETRHAESSEEADSFIHKMAGNDPCIIDIYNPDGHYVKRYIQPRANRGFVTENPSHD